ncbi:MAG: hypothetical protein CL609_05045 [Anaerolineaceae bacterium]|nr:hypothetical protein [Anaerolineaceae bacterium]
MKKTPHVIVIGAGVGGLTTAALLLKSGFQVTVLEAHTYPGGSAGTFYHQGYRFDAGATLAGGFTPGGPHFQIEEALGLKFPTMNVDPAWITYIGGEAIHQWHSRQQWFEEIIHHFPESLKFWKKQEKLAALAWQLSSRNFPYPPQTLQESLTLVRAFRPALLGTAPYLFSKIADLLPKKRSHLLKPFLDSQLLISAQTTSEHTNVLYGSAALDLPRRDVKYIEGGIGSISKLLAEWIQQQGGEVRYRQQVTQLISKNGKITGVMTNKGLSLQGDYFIANLTPAGLKKLITDPKTQFDSKQNNRASGWGAFTLYVGADQTVIHNNIASHLQVIVDPEKPLGEGNSIFISISPAEDSNRAPAGKTAISVSTHTNIHPWWTLANQDPDAYEARKKEYTERVLSAMEVVLPDIRTKSSLILPGTPVTFQFYTRRPNGLVGGSPQESLFSVRGPGTGFNNLWLVGDSVFPGQSTAAVTIGAQRVARLVKQTRFPS